MKKNLVRVVLAVLAVGVLSGCDPRTAPGHGTWTITTHRGHQAQCQHWTPDNNATCD